MINAQSPVLSIMANINHLRKTLSLLLYDKRTRLTETKQCAKVNNQSMAGPRCDLAFLTQSHCMWLSGHTVTLVSSVTIKQMRITENLHDPMSFCGLTGPQRLFAVISDLCADDAAELVLQWKEGRLWGHLLFHSTTFTENLLDARYCLSHK